MAGKGGYNERELDALLHGLCEGRLDDELRGRLLKVLASDDQAMRRYVETIHLASEVIDWTRRDDQADVLEVMLGDLCQQKACDVELAAHFSSDRTNSVEESTLGDRVRRKRSSSTVWIAATAACFLAICFGLFWGRDAQQDALVGNSGEHLAVDDANRSSDQDQASTKNHAVSSNAKIYVARIIEATSGVLWKDNQAPFDLMLRVGVGNRVAIDAGVVRLKYVSGAEIILHGPAEFTPTGPASGHLAKGRVTGKVLGPEKKKFTLSTPSAQVVDLGTVFGVAVGGSKAGDALETDVCVFDGEVEVSSLRKGVLSRQPIRLVEGMSVRLAGNGDADLSAAIDRSQFLSELPMNSNDRLAANEISLVDAFIDGPGLSHRLVATLDPNTGKPDEAPTRGLRHGAGVGYRLAVYSEFVDGVFIPTRDGNQVQIDSYGKAANLPETTGHINGTVWARRPIPGLTLATPFTPDPEETSDQVWEVGATFESFERLEQSRLGIIGLHANVGLSFDLLAIQSIEGQRAERFRCVLANLGGTARNTSSTSLESDSSRADVRVYVDGVERSSCLGLDGRQDELIDVAIDVFSRVLTIVVTDAGDEDGYDQVVLIDPTIEMAY